MKNSKIREKIRKLKNKLNARKRVRSSTDSSTSDSSTSDSSLSDLQPSPPKRVRRVISSESSNDEQVNETDNVAEIDLENNDDDIFSILGEDPTVCKDFGDEIHSHLAVRWNNILQKGIKKESRSDFIKKYLPPSNCTFLLPPKLNDEIKAAVQETAVKRDFKLEQKQIQLGTGITCIGKAFDVALKIPDKKLREEIIKYISDSGQILTDLHYLESLTRRSLLGQGSNKGAKDAIKDIPRDKYLFGEGLPEKLKAVKACSKSATDIKVKPPKGSSSRLRTNNSKAPSNSYAAPATLNWRGSSHRPMNSLTAGAYRERRPALPSSAPRRSQTSQRPQQVKRS